MEKRINKLNGQPGISLAIFGSGYGCLAAFSSLMQQFVHTNKMRHKRILWESPSKLEKHAKHASLGLQGPQSRQVCWLVAGLDGAHTISAPFYQRQIYSIRIERKLNCHKIKQSR